jgi:magnesium-transporting ATPase (P-type)
MALNKFSDAKNIVEVMRGGTSVEINIDDLKVGDLIKMKTGMSIPCDGILLPGASGVSCDEGAMTGESIECKKEPLDQCLARRAELLADGHKMDVHDLPSPLLLSGTQIQTGEGWFMIIMIGKNSSIGKIQERLKDESGAEMTPL